MPSISKSLLASFSICSLVLIACVSLLADRPASLKTEIQVPQNLGALHPRISPDGEWIAVSYHGSIWKVPRAGGTMTRLTSEAGFDIEPAWSPDSKMIAYVHSSQMFGGRVKLIQADSGKQVPLPVNIDSVDSTFYSKLEFHPDGRLFGRFHIDGKHWDLALVDLKTGAATSIAKPGRFGLSPDGQTVVYAQTMDTTGNQWGNDGPQSDIWKVSTTGGTPEKLTKFPSRVFDVCWSADGSSFYVVSDVGTIHNDLWQIPLRNPERAKRVTVGAADEERPSVSLDGRWLAFSDNRRGATSLTVRNLGTGDDSTISVSDLDFGVPVGRVRIKVVDKETGMPTVARISMRQDEGQFVYPPAALHRMRIDQGHFYCDDTTEFVVPAGKFTFKAFRGPEYNPAQGSVDVRSGGTAALIIEMQRWTNLARRGWYSGENHIHANYGYGSWYNTPESMLTQCTGEDLQVCNYVVANSDTDSVFDREFFRGGIDPISTPNTILYWNEEFRSTSWGHMTLVNLKQLVEPIFTGFKDTTNPLDFPTNSDIADRVHLQKGLVNYTHAAYTPNDPFGGAYAGKSIPVDVALGKIDTMDLNNSYPASAPLWYSLLNCGFHLSPSAGTDCFLNRIPSVLPGADRVYVKIDGEFSYAAWIEGLKAGRSFVTSGPMLEFQVEDRDPGDTIKLSKPRSVKIMAKANAQFPLSTVEVIYNGQVVHSGVLSSDKLSGEASTEFMVPDSGWILLRAVGPIHKDHHHTAFEAYSSPVYVEVEGRKTRSKKDAEYFLQWIDRLSLFLRQRDRIPTPELKQHVEQQLEAARAVYFNLAQQPE